MRAYISSFLLLLVACSVQAFLPANTLPKPMVLRTNRLGPVCPSMVASNKDPLEPVKRLWIGLERMLVTITQGTEMAEAAAALEEERLFGSRRLAKARNAMRDASQTLLRNAGGVLLRFHDKDEESFSQTPAVELSGGFNEGAGDDLPLIRQIAMDNDSKYSEKAIRTKYEDSAFKD